MKTFFVPPLRNAPLALLFFGTVQLLLLMIVAECVYPSYSASNNFISDLGVGSTSLLFNAPMIIFGACVVCSTLQLKKDEAVLRNALFIAGAGAIGVGVFPETTDTIHLLCALAAFLFGAVAAVASSKKLFFPSNAFAFLAGIISLAALALFVSGNYFGLGPGGM